MPKITKQTIKKLPLEEQVELFIEEVARVSPTVGTWSGGKGVHVGRMRMKATESQIEAVNRLGAIHGCHSCGCKVETDKNQPWIGDHQPPTELSKNARRALGLPATIDYDAEEVRLLPQCDECSRAQAVTVKRVNKEVAEGEDPDLNGYGKRLFGIGKQHHTHSIPATGSKVSPAQGYSIQNLGTLHGCHSCNSRYPKDSYHADHNPPVCYTFSHVINILRWAKKNIDKYKDLDIRQDFHLLPQCPRCSHEQGGRMRALSTRATELARKMGFTVYRD